MHSIKITSLFTLALSTLVASQALIDPSTVPLPKKEIWCTNQKAACPLLCTQEHASDQPTANDCDDETLAFNCVCDNGVVPNATEFSQTIPYFECQEANEQCAKNCGEGNNACVIQCRTARPCGAQNPTRVNTSAIATMSATKSASNPTGTGADAQSTDDFSGFGGDSSAATSSSAASANFVAKAFNFRSAETAGLAVVFVGFFAGFSILL